MAAGTSYDVYGIGQCALDYLGRIRHYPPADVKCEFTDLVIQGGGPVATALVALSRWGFSCSFAGVVGDDQFGPAIEDSLQAEGVDTSGLLVRSGFQSQFAFIVAEQGSGRRTIFWRRPTGPPPRPEELDYRLITGAKVVHTDGLFAAAAIAAATAARKAGVPVVVDAGSLREGMLELARLSDFFLASETFARALDDGGDPVAICRRLAALGPRVTCVTLGERGYVAWIGGDIIRRPAYRVPAVDTTGCGDVFHAGFVYGLLKNLDWQICLDLGAWAAAQVSLQLGGRAGIPSRQQMEARLASGADDLASDLDGGD